MDPDAELHVTRRVGLSGDFSERGRAGQAEARIARLEVIQHVRDRDVQRRSRLFPVDADILDQVHVDVPGRQAAEVVIPAAARIETQYAWPEFTRSEEH